MAVPRYLIGDVFDRLGELEDGSFDLIVTSPPFYKLRSYLPDGHVHKAREIGSERTPAEFLDTMLELTAEWRRLLAPHGSIAVELGDSYAGTSSDGARTVESREHRREREGTGADGGARVVGANGGAGHPLDKSLIGIPTLYAWCLAYGRNLLTGEESPAGMWRIRTVKPWIRTNPPVGALGDKERPATSYITVATVARDRYFDLDAVRSTTATNPTPRAGRKEIANPDRGTNSEGTGDNPAGAPPLDWSHTVDLILDAELAARAAEKRRPGGGPLTSNGVPQSGRTTPGVVSSGGARGYHLRRALERAGILATVDAVDVSPKGYSGAHYAVWPPELVRLLVDEMCPRRVCTTCGQPSRRQVGDTDEYAAFKADNEWGTGGKVTSNLHRPNIDFTMPRRTTVGWSDCGHDTWRPGHVLDPFAGSGTTLAVAAMMGRDADGIDLDERNARLAFARLGTSLDVDGVDLDYLLPPLTDDERAELDPSPPADTALS